MAFLKQYLYKVIPKIGESIKLCLPARDIKSGRVRRCLGKSSDILDSRSWQKAFSQPFYDLFNRGGKRIRPVLCCLTYHCLGGRSPDIYNFSAITEFLHNASLIIDDIQDNSNLRRGKACLHKIYGLSIAVNIGIFLHLHPLSIIRQSRLSDKLKLRLYEVITQSITDCYIGQGMDVLWTREANYNISLDKYFKMAMLKTSSFFILSLKVAALLAGAPSQDLKSLEKIASLIGVAFQIQDDVLNLKPTGGLRKETAEDIREGKLTYPVVYTLTKASSYDKIQLIKMLCIRNRRDKTKVKEAISLMEKYDAFRQAEDFSVRLIEEAKHRTIILFKKSPIVYQKIYQEILDSFIRRKV